MFTYKRYTTNCKLNASEVLNMNELAINKLWCKLKAKYNKSFTTLLRGHYGKSGKGEKH